MSATAFISKMIRYAGMGSLSAFYQVPDSINETSLHDEDVINQEIKRLMLSSQELAEKTVSVHEQLLLQIADYLSDYRSMSKQMILQFCQQHGQNFDTSSLIIDGDHLFYRDHLKKKVRDTSPRNIKPTTRTTEISLNKENQ
jgi:hypothetical protein